MQRIDPFRSTQQRAGHRLRRPFGKSFAGAVALSELVGHPGIVRHYHGQSTGQRLGEYARSANRVALPGIRQECNVGAQQLIGVTLGRHRPDHCVETGGGLDSTTISFDCLKNSFEEVFGVFVELLREPEFREEHIDRLAELASEVHFAQNQIIFREGDDIHDFHLIVSGRVALEMEAPDHIIRVHTLGPGDELGWSAILMGRGKYFQARALERSVAVSFDGPALLEACREDKSFGFALMYRMLGVVSERLQGTRLQVLDMYSPHARRAGA